MGIVLCIKTLMKPIFFLFNDEILYTTTLQQQYNAYQLSIKTCVIRYISQQLFLPDDANRVILKVEEGTNNSEYINASYVHVGFTIVSHTFTVEYGFLVNIKHTLFEFHQFQTFF